MLTKDLLNCNCRAGKLSPRFLHVDEPEMIALADNLIGTYSVFVGKTRDELEEALQPILGLASSLKIAKGLKKVLDDLCKFTAPDEWEYAAERRRVFQVSSRLFHEKNWSSPEEFREAVAKQLNENPLLKTGTLYPDLPGNERLIAVPPMVPDLLIQRYNMALVQGVLLTADSLEINVADPEAARLRRLFKYLQFFRLFAAISAEHLDAALEHTAYSRKNGCSAVDFSPDSLISLSVSGPGSILTNSRKYGVQLASFFPAVCSLHFWRMRAQVVWNGKKTQLKLDNTSGVVCPYHHFAACTPKEFQLFQRHFPEVASTWTLCEEEPLLKIKGGDIIVPDFTFRNEHGRIVSLELFHCWHSRKLLERLKWIHDHPEMPLILGIDRSLFYDENVKALQAAAQDRTFLFRDYPTVEKVLTCLKNWER